MKNYIKNVCLIDGTPGYFIPKTDTNQDMIEALKYNGTYFPEIVSVKFNTKTETETARRDANGNLVINPDTGKPYRDSVKLDKPIYTTIVDFADNTRSIVTCSANDHYDRETGVVNAIVKRMMGKVGPTGTIEGNGTGIRLKRIVESGVDQQAEAERIKKEKIDAKARHEAKQKADHDAAVERKVKRQKEAIEILFKALQECGVSVGVQPYSEDSCTCGGNCGCNKSTTGACKSNSSGNEDEYVRPNKPFSEFTQEEKRAYWRYQNKKRRAK